MTMSAAKNGKAAGMFLLVSFFSSIATAGTVLDRGHQILIDKGFQIQAQIEPVTAGSFNSARWTESNFTSADVSDGTKMPYLGLPPGMPWGRTIPLGTNEDKTELLPYAVRNDFLYNSEAYDAANLVTMRVGDEDSLGNPAIVAEIARLLALWRTNYPSVIGCSNQSGGQETVPTLQAYMAAAQPDMVMMDSYAFFSSPPGNSPTDFYVALQKYRLLGLAGNDGTGATPIPYGAYTQGAKVGASGHIISDSEVRLNQFAPWAFGYKLTDLWYYNNTGLDTYPNVLFNNQDETSPTAVFYSYAETNRQGRNLGATLVRLLSTDIRFIVGQNSAGANNTRPSGVNAWDNTSHPYITAITATNLGSLNGGKRGDVVVGYFKPLREEDDGPSYTNETYFMILNGLTDATGTAVQTQQDIRLDFNFGTSGITSLQRLSRSTGLVEVVSLTHDTGSQYHVTLTLDGGTGDLLKFNDGAPFITGPAGGLWSDVTYADNSVKANVNGGADKSGGAYTSNKPDTGTWAMTYNLAAGATPVNVFSARYVKFLSAGPSAEKAGSLGGQDNSLVIKVNLSKYATAALWDPGSINYTVSSGSSVQLKYSVDGAKFIPVYTSPTGSGSVHPSVMSLTFTAGTKVIYLAYTGTVGTGTQAYWSAASGGLTTITPDPRPFDEWMDIAYGYDNVQGTTAAMVKANVNAGLNTGGYAYTVTKPSSGDWTVNYGLGGGSTPVNAWSACGIMFKPGGVWTTEFGKYENTSYVMKFNLSEPVNSVTWAQPRFYRVINAGNTMEAKWSVDGVNWTSCYTFPLPDPAGNYTTPDPVTFAVPSTSVLYLGWFGTLGSGRFCSFETESTGAITFSPTTPSPWNAVTYNPGSVQSNVNAGTTEGGYAYTSTKPLSTVWGENYSLAGGSVPLNIWSADYLEFNSGGVVSRNNGVQSNSLVIKINLSETIFAATWQPARNYTWFSGGGTVEMKYSTDGVNFTTLYSVANGAGGYDLAPVLSMSFPGGTDTLYIGWFCTVPAGSGGSARMEFESTGPLAFLADPTAYWTLVSYDPTSIQSNVNGGTNLGGEAYTSVKPSSGDWTFHYNANAGTNPLKIWAANDIQFQSGTFCASNTGMDSRLVMRINLSEPVSSATWTPTRFWYGKSDDVSNVKLMYSTDGVNFTTCFTAPNNGGQNYAYPDPMVLNFATPTNVIYLAYVGEIGTGTTAFWVGEDGNLTFSLPYQMTRCTYDTPATQSQVNNGTDQGGQAYTSTRSTTWGEDYNLEAGMAPVKVWSADYIHFKADGVDSRNDGNDSNTLILKINLSEPVGSATWQPARNYKWFWGGGSVAMKYSTDGVNFTTIYTVADGSGGYDVAPVLSMSFPGGTNTLYIGWFCNVPAGSGGVARMSFESTGPLTFTPAPTSPVLNVTPSSQAVTSPAGTTTFAVSNTGVGTMAWTATVIEGGSWLSIASGASGTNAGTITANYQANTGLQRTGTIRVDAGSAGLTDVTVIQAAGQVQPPTVHGTVTYTDYPGFPLNTVTIEIRNGATVVETHSALALTGSTGSKTYSFTTNLTGGPYTLAVVKNAQTGWKEAAQSGVTLAGDTTVNFTVTHALAGDASMDNKVDVSDLGILAANYGQTGKNWSLGDFSGDSKVDVSDLGILAAHYGQGSGGATQASDLPADMKALGLSFDTNTGEPVDTQKTQTEENPVVKSLGGCGAAGLPLIAGLLLMGLLLVKLEE